MTKKCKNCGAELPENASFCPHCTQSQIQRTAMKPPHPWRKKALYAALCILVLAGAVLAVRLSQRPRTYEGGAAVTYTDRDGTYELLLSFFPGDIANNRPVANKTVRLSADESSADTPMLGIYQDGAIADTERFFEKVERCTLEAFPNENNALRFDPPAYNADFQPAARACDLFYTGASGTNELVWTLTMKNGDIIRMKQTFEVVPLVHQIYSAEDTALDTLEDLQALLTRIDAEVPPDTVVDIYLPPVTYRGELTILSRAVNLYGCTDGSGRTTFSGTLSVHSDKPANVRLFDLDFAGSGGTGLSAVASVYMVGCSFSGWDVGAAAQDGGMICVENCEFRNNGIGFKYNSGGYHSFSDEFPGCVIADNRIGVQFARLYGTICIDFAGTTFSGNQTNIDNQISYPVDTNGAIFK